MNTVYKDKLRIYVYSHFTVYIIIIICIFAMNEMLSIDSMYMHYQILHVRESTTYSLIDSLRMGNSQFDGREGCGECWDADISCG